tara:strand:+ start:608 stop:721 length:114 start_codon:yes stop_codon:yes gene_type:complete
VILLEEIFGDTYGDVLVALMRLFLVGGLIVYGYLVGF